MIDLTSILSPNHALALNLAKAEARKKESSADPVQSQATELQNYHQVQLDHTAALSLANEEARKIKNSRDPLKAQATELQKYNQSKLTQTEKSHTHYIAPVVQSSDGLERGDDLLNAIRQYVQKSSASAEKKQIYQQKMSALDRLAKSIEIYMNQDRKYGLHNPATAQMVSGFLSCLHQTLSEIIGDTVIDENKKLTAIPKTIIESRKVEYSEMVETIEANEALKSEILSYSKKKDLLPNTLGDLLVRLTNTIPNPQKRTAFFISFSRMMYDTYGLDILTDLITKDNAKWIKQLIKLLTNIRKKYDVGTRRSAFENVEPSAPPPPAEESPRILLSEDALKAQNAPYLQDPRYPKTIEELNQLNAPYLQNPDLPRPSAPPAPVS